ncbi:MgtC/SapB family protein [Gramella sp. MAR_2010_147]|uniref:MgtC/SapB family protein n=1 Tax=Gramella sp. MAR_2010_147 TaxID=1250205 RepID=UPI00087D9AE1|nr:MgtC/SapB family protein [Gramella sp. MAR_2010_147]SDR71796.1 putative Mg2+ transporter-C (MgtC) family protein [Gramella sp. MAR_2010_147]
MELDIWEFILKIGIAAISGAFMGLERQYKGKPAGLKTYSLVALGAATFITISLMFQESDSTDMTRIVGQIVVGVGFLGAGVILHEKNETAVTGLATSAAIWCSAAAGCLAGFGLYLHLIALTLFVIFINLIFGFLNGKLRENSNDDNY